MAAFKTIPIAELEPLVTDLFKKEVSLLQDLQLTFMLITPQRWQYIWYYRFLRISPTYNYFLCLVDKYLHLKKIRKTNKKKNYSDNVVLKELIKCAPKKFQDRVPALFSTYQLNGDLRKKTLSEWWFITGERIFAGNYRTLDEMFYSVGNEKINPVKIKNALSKLDETLNRFNKYGTPDFVCLGINLNCSKKDILKTIDTYLDNKVNTQEDTWSNIIKIQKSKAHEKKFEEAYQAIFFKHLYPDLTNSDLAKKAKVLRFSQHHANDSNPDSKRSLESGFCRLIANAIRISENAAYCLFPSDSDENILDDISYNEEYLNLNTFFNVYYQTLGDAQYSANDLVLSGTTDKWEVDLHPFVS